MYYYKLSILAILISENIMSKLGSHKILLTALNLPWVIIGGVPVVKPKTNLFVMAHIKPLSLSRYNLQ